MIVEDEAAIGEQNETQRMFQVPISSALKEDHGDNEKGTLAMTLKSSLFQLNSVGLSERDNDAKPSRLAVHSLLEVTD